MPGPAPDRVLGEGKTKVVLRSDEPERVLLKFKDDITALDGVKHDLLPGKGRINAAVSARLFEELQNEGVPTHYVRMAERDLMLATKLTMIKLEVVCRNRAAGHFLKRLTMFKRGEPLRIPIVEFFLKSDELHDPMLTEDHVVALGMATRREVGLMKHWTRVTNRSLTKYMAARGLILVDFKLEFGRDSRGRLLVGDELNIDSMRLWDSKTGETLDKDIYRQGRPLSDVFTVYEESMKRILGRGA